MHSGSINGLITSGSSAHWSLGMVLVSKYFQPEKLYIENILQEILLKNWSQGYCVQTALNISFALSWSWQFGVIFTLVLNPKSAVKSSRQTWHTFSTITNSLPSTRLTNSSWIVFKAFSFHYKLDWLYWIWFHKIQNYSFSVILYKVV